MLRGRSFDKYWDGQCLYVSKENMSIIQTFHPLFPEYRKNHFFILSKTCNTAAVSAPMTVNWVYGVQPFHMFALSSHTARFSWEELEKLAAPCTSPRVSFVTKPTLHADCQQPGSHDAGETDSWSRGGVYEQLRKLRGSRRCPLESALSPAQYLSPALVQTTALSCNNMSSLTICLLSTAFFPPQQFTLINF